MHALYLYYPTHDTSVNTRCLANKECPSQYKSSRRTEREENLPQALFFGAINGQKIERHNQQQLNT